MSGKGISLLEKVKIDFLHGNGLRRKQALKEVLMGLWDASGSTSGKPVLGDDAAVICRERGNLLFATDGIDLDSITDLYWAGYCAILVNVNDIYAMGGEPIALVNVIGGSNREIREIVAGIKAGCRKFAVPMVGGHLHPESKSRQVSVAILGLAEKVLSSFGARSGDDLVIAIDLSGSQYREYPHWDSTSRKSSHEVLACLKTVRLLADKNLVTAAKDISNPGILGTIGMLLESSGVGAEIDLSLIPTPEPLKLHQWLSFYPGFGFVFSVQPENTDAVCKHFTEVGVNSVRIGKVKQIPTIEICFGSNIHLELIDFRKNHITGIKQWTLDQ